MVRQKNYYYALSLVSFFVFCRVQSTDSFKSYNALDVSEFTHYRINHSKTFVNDKNHINGIENFWNQAKRHLRKFNGVPKEHFHLYLKECKWRFNHSDPNSQFLQLKQWVKQGLN